MERLILNVLLLKADYKPRRKQGVLRETEVTKGPD